jgi:hypothetical protein
MSREEGRMNGTRTLALTVSAIALLGVSATTLAQQVRGTPGAPAG